MFQLRLTETRLTEPVLGIVECGSQRGQFRRRGAGSELCSIPEQLDGATQCDARFHDEFRDGHRYETRQADRDGDRHGEPVYCLRRRKCGHGQDLQRPG
jgi:hypothetical protein